MSAEEYTKKLWSWAPFNSCFRRGIKITDIDGAVENRGHFLWLEGKSGGQKMERGQRKFFGMLIKLPVMTFVEIGGTPPEGIEHWRASGECSGEGNDLLSLQIFMANWFNQTEAGLDKQ